MNKIQCYCKGEIEGHPRWAVHVFGDITSEPSEEKDQYGHKIIRPTLPDDTFEGLKEEIKERVSEEKRCCDFKDCICGPIHHKGIHLNNCSVFAPKQEEWEWKFDNFRNYDGKEYGHGIHQEIKSFISQLLKKEREQLKQQILEGLPEKTEITHGVDMITIKNYNNAIDDVTQSIERLFGKEGK